MNSRKPKDTHNEAIRELTQLSERLECDVDLVESMSLDEAQAELRELNLDPNKTVSPREIEPNSPERKRAHILVVGGAGFIGQQTWELLGDTDKESRSDIRELYVMHSADGGRVVAKSDSTSLFPEKTTTELLSEIISHKIFDTQRRIEVDRELFSRSTLELEHIFSELKSFSPESLRDESWIETSKTRSKLCGTLVTASTTAAVLVGILNVPIPKFPFALLSTVVTLFLVWLTGHVFRVGNNASLGSGLAKLKRSMLGTSALIFGSLIGIGVLRWTGVSSNLLFSGFVIATEFLLILLAGQGSASHALLNWPARFRKRLQKIEKQNEEAKHRLMAEESELKSLFDASTRLLDEHQPNVDPARFTIMN
jgi:hypothetical protein